MLVSDAVIIKRNCPRCRWVSLTCPRWESGKIPRWYWSFWWPRTFCCAFPTISSHSLYYILSKAATHMQLPGQQVPSPCSDPIVDWRRVFFYFAKPFHVIINCYLFLISKLRPWPHHSVFSKAPEAAFSHFFAVLGAVWHCGCCLLCARCKAMVVSRPFMLTL